VIPFVADADRIGRVRLDHDAGPVARAVHPGALFARYVLHALQPLGMVAGVAHAHGRVTSHNGAPAVAAAVDPGAGVGGVFDTRVFGPVGRGHDFILAASRHNQQTGKCQDQRT